MAEALVRRTVKWGNAMLDLLEYYRKAGQLDMAIKAGEQIILEFPYEHAVYEVTINLCIDAKQYLKGIFYARKAYALKKTPEMAIRLSILHLKLDEPEKAIPYMDYLIMSGGSMDIRSVKDISQKIIAAKKRLATDENNREIKNEIYHYYMTIQNIEAAEKYK